ncbi:MAG: putative zinc-binding metallopeptidase [Acidobacteriota bacterium]
MAAYLRKRSPTSRRTRPPQPPWARWTQERLLDLRMCELKLRIEGSPLEPRIQALELELDRCGIRFRPHFWLPDEWFSPAGIPGIALPFYLAHARLTRLERNQMLEVEGGSKVWCMRILRHETGHAIDHAFRLHRRRRWQQLFGRSSLPYPVVYRPRPASRGYVHHLDSWYAQSHPDEDFAETFAVWMSTRRRIWESRYKGWPALRKLEYVDQLMTEIAPLKPPVRTRRQLDPISQLRRTLRQHYEDRRARYGINDPHLYDRELLALFSTDKRHARRQPASRFLLAERASLLEPVARWTGQTPYTVDQILREMISRCRKLRLRVGTRPAETRRQFLVILTVQTMNNLQRGRLRWSL